VEPKAVPEPDTKPVPDRPKLVKRPKEPKEPPVNEQTRTAAKSVFAYRGLLRRTDGKLMVLLQNMETKATGFYPTGSSLDDLQGLEVVDAEAATLSVKLPDGTARTLPLGAPATIRGGQFVD
jgi:hypothetical protein